MRWVVSVLPGLLLAALAGLLSVAVTPSTARAEDKVVDARVNETFPVSLPWSPLAPCMPPPGAGPAPTNVTRFLAAAASDSFQ